jgi:hypothetical protein
LCDGGPKTTHPPLQRGRGFWWNVRTIPRNSRAIPVSRVVVAANHGANRKPATQEQGGDGPPHRSELTGRPRYRINPLFVALIAEFSWFNFWRCLSAAF